MTGLDQASDSGDGEGSHRGRIGGVYETGGWDSMTDQMCQGKET